MNSALNSTCRPLILVASCLFFALMNSTAKAGGLHISASVGYLSAEQTDNDSDHGNFAGTATVGVEVLGLVLATVYAELERTQLLGDGEWNGEDYDYKSDGVFLAVRTLGPLYAVGRVGYVKAEFDPEIRERAGSRDEAISVGVGYSLGIRNELLYTRIEHDGGGTTNTISFLIGF